MLPSPFSKFSIASEKKLILVLLLFLMLCMGFIRYFDTLLVNSICENGIVSFEFAKELGNSKAMLNSWGVEATKSAYLSLSLDFLFLIAYALFISILIHKIVKGHKENSFFSKLGKLLIWMVFLAAFFDVIENIALLNLLSGNLNQIWSSIAYYFAILKFTLILGGIIYILIGWLLILAKKFQFKTN